MLIYICYKECRYVAVCQLIPSVYVCVFVCVCVCVCVCGGGGVPIWSRLRHGTTFHVSVLVWDFSVLKCSEVHELEQ